MVISVQKLTQVIKSNTTGFLRIQRHNRKILKIVITPYLQILKWEYKRENIVKR